MPRKKKQFVDKKTASTFKLQNRSQRDPLSVDESAPQNVLIPMGQRMGFSDMASETTCGRLKRWGKQKLHGIGFEDNYDYMQHLKLNEKSVAELVPVCNRAPQLCPIDELREMEEEDEELVEITRDEKPVLKLPAVVFASEVEANENLFQRDTQAIGPRPDWDPEVVAALDGDFEEGEEMDDEFMQQLIGLEDGEIPDEDVDSRFGDFDSDDLMSDDGESNDGMSRFSRISDLSCSVMRRSGKLPELDAKFEVLFEGQYARGNGFGDNIEETADMYDDDDNHGMTFEQLQENFGDVLNDPLLDPNGMKNEGMVLKEMRREPPPEINKKAILDKFEDERDHDEDLITIYKKVPAVKHDCVSILSTYSNLYNRPKVLEVSELPGYQKNTKKGKSKTMLKEEKRKNKEVVIDEEEETETMDENSSVATNNIRKKNETNEEKRMRKKAFKADKKVRRQEKKATKTAFQAEKTRQQKELINLQQNIQGIKI